MDSIYNVHDDAKDKDFELELSWVCEESRGLHQFVPKDIADEAAQLAKVNAACLLDFQSGGEAGPMY